MSIEDKIFKFILLALVVLVNIVDLSISQPELPGNDNGFAKFINPPMERDDYHANIDLEELDAPEPSNKIDRFYYKRPWTIQLRRVPWTYSPPRGLGGRDEEKDYSFVNSVSYDPTRKLPRARGPYSIVTPYGTILNESKLKRDPSPLLRMLRNGPNCDGHGGWDRLSNPSGCEIQKFLEYEAEAERMNQIG